MSNQHYGAVRLVVWMLLTGCGLVGVHTGAAVPAASTSTEAQAQKPGSTAVAHFWFDYQAQPDPGRRVWVHVDDSTWTELYPNGSLFRYKAGPRATLQGMSGITVRKVTADPAQTWTLAEGSFEVFIPDKDTPRLILAFRRYQSGRWSEWRPFASIHPIE